MPARISHAGLSPAHIGSSGESDRHKKKPTPDVPKDTESGQKVVVTNPILGENGELSEQKRVKENEERRNEEGDETRQNRTET